MLKAIILAGIIAAVLLLIKWRSLRRKKQLDAYTLPAGAPALLEAHVAFYRKLDAAQRTRFESRLRDFLARTKVTGVGGVIVSDLDRLLVAASAIIPIAAFPDWQYNNISEVLLYPNTFNRDFATEGADRNVLGMVGNGALNGEMILSQHALREGFASDDGYNTGIHEFVHLLDKADGATDGIPEYLLTKQYVLPWLTEMHRTMAAMREGDTDINPYGATNEAEFFAVVSEYFFEKPEALQEHHPVLFALLSKMFRPGATADEPADDTRSPAS